MMPQANAALADARVPNDIVATVLDPTAYADGRIHDAYKWLRANNPLGLVEHPDFDPFWLVTRYADIRAVEMDNQAYLAGARAMMLLDSECIRRTTATNGGKVNSVLTLPNMDPPMHVQHRMIAQNWFTPSNLKNREVAVREIARNAVAAFRAKGASVDGVDDLALYYPLRVVMSIFGVPETDEPMMLRLTQELFAPPPSGVTPHPEMVRGAALAEHRRQNLIEFSQYFIALGDDRRANPRDDIASVIANSIVDGHPISREAEIGYYMALATAGHDTTSSSSAVALWQLAENPDEFAKVKADPGLIPGLVEEAVRWACPVKHFMRTTSRPVELGGRSLPEGTWLMQCYASGSRDEAVLDDPDRFRIDRAVNRHLAFGFGPHMCLGQHLARLEMRLLFEELLPLVKSLSLAGEPKNSPNWSVNGPVKLPLRIEWN